MWEASGVRLCVQRALCPWPVPSEQQTHQPSHTQKLDAVERLLELAAAELRMAALEVGAGVPSHNVRAVAVDDMSDRLLEEQVGVECGRGC